MHHCEDCAFRRDSDYYYYRYMFIKCAYFSTKQFEPRFPQATLHLTRRCGRRRGEEIWGTYGSYEYYYYRDIGWELWWYEWELL